MAKGGGEREGRLELEEDPAFHRRERVMRRVGTGSLLVLLAAAFAGVFGSGPLSHAEASSDDSSLVVRYERFTRNRAPTILHFTTRRRDTSRPVRSDTVFQVGLSRDFAEAIDIEHILPEPSKVATSASAYLYDFARAQPESVSHVIVRYRPKALGWISAVISAAESNLRFRQLVYP